MKPLPCLLAAASVLAACATPYNPPSSGPTAKVTFLVPQDDMFGIGQTTSVVSGEDCGGPALIANFQPLSSTRETTRDLAVGQRQYLRAFMSNSRSYPIVHSCTNLVSFIPEPGEKYTLRQVIAGPSCAVELRQETDKKVPSTFQIHVAKACI